MEDKPTQLLNAKQVATRLNISQAMAYQLMQRGDIKTVRMGRAVRVTPEALEEFIRQGGTTNAIHM